MQRVHLLGLGTLLSRTRGLHVEFTNDKTPPYLDKKSGERKKKEEEREKTLPLSRLTYRILIIRLVITPLSRLNDQRASRKREGDLDKGIEGYRNRVREWIYGVGSLARSFERIAPSLSLTIPAGDYLGSVTLSSIGNGVRITKTLDKRLIFPFSLVSLSREIKSGSLVIFFF